MTRITCAMRSEDGASTPRDSIIYSINSLAEELCQKAVEISSENSHGKHLNPSLISEFVVV